MTKPLKGKYHRTLIGLNGKDIPVDVYRVIDAFNVEDPALQHLIKKALCAGLRGHKDQEQDLRDIVDSAQEALTLFLQKKELYVTGKNEPSKHCNSSSSLARQ